MIKMVTHINIIELLNMIKMIKMIKMFKHKSLAPFYLATEMRTIKNFLCVT